MFGKHIKKNGQDTAREFLPLSNAMNGACKSIIFNSLVEIREFCYLIFNALVWGGKVFVSTATLKQHVEFVL